MEELNFSRKRKTIIGVTAEVLALATLIAPILIATTFGIPCDDDFGNSLSYIKDNGFSWTRLISDTISIYKGWQGTFLGNVLVSIPTYLLGGIMALRIEFFLSVVFFFCASAMLSQAFIVFWRIEGDNKLEKTGYALLVWILLLGYMFTIPKLGELFYWHTGIGMYTMPLSLGMMAIYCLITSERKTSVHKTIIGALLGFLSAGAALDVVALICFIMFCSLVCNYCKEQKWHSYYLIFVVTLLGAIINTVAPGNYVRHENYDEKIRFGKAILMTVYRIHNQFLNGASERGLIVVIIVAAVMAYRYCVEPRVQSAVLLAIGCYLGIFMTDYPVILGTGSVALPQRCEGIEILSFAIFAIIFGIGMGALLKNKEFHDKVFQIVVTVAFLLQIILLIGFVELKNYAPYKTARNILNGEYERVAREEVLALETIKNAKEEDVVLESFGGNYWVDLKEMELTTDANYWVNQSVARFYGKETVRVRE